MEEISENNLVSNHLISDGTEDVVLLDSAATISADLTETANEDQKINLRSTKDEYLDSSYDEDGSNRNDGNDGDDGKRDESQNARDREHKVFPVSTDGTKCKISR